MEQSFTISCDHCEKEVTFEIGEIADLEHYIEQEVSEADRAARSEYEGMVDPADMEVDERVLHDLAIAIRRGDQAECKILLDKLADECGGKAAHFVELGWFSPVAKVPA